MIARIASKVMQGIDISVRYVGSIFSYYAISH